jgi:hypothetical protein
MIRRKSVNPLSGQAGLQELVRISAIIPDEQVVNRFRPLPHPLSPLLCGGLEETVLSFVADNQRPVAHESPLPGLRPVAGQHVPQSRMAPPAGDRCRHRIDCRADTTPDLVHPAPGLALTRDTA